MLYWNTYIYFQSVINLHIHHNLLFIIMDNKITISFIGNNNSLLYFGELYLYLNKIKTILHMLI
jgi:hypothetical protein